MLSYMVPGFQTTNTTTYKTMLELLPASGNTFRVYDFMAGCYAAPADQVVRYSARKITATGTGTAATPLPANDMINRAATTTAKENNTAEPTKTGVEWIEVPTHMATPFRWIAAPGGEYVSDQATNGACFQSQALAFTGNTTCTVHFFEG